MEWLLTTLRWYLALFVLGLIFFPLTKKIFNKFFYDAGYPFSKAIGLLFLSYSAFTLGTIKILPFYQESLIFLLLLFLIINVLLFKRFNNGSLNKAQIVKKTAFIIVEELVFVASLLFWVYVRGQEPSIRGLEKFMDFGFMNSILRSKYFPPPDMWFAGKSINYYYFGHLTGAVLTKLSGISPFETYNLILATIFALGITQTFSLCFNVILNAFKSLKLSLIGGILASFLVNFGGNLHAIYAFTKGYPNDNPVPFWQILSAFNPGKYWYPNATRFIPFTIHEFPIYSYIVADLHGHVFDIPFVLLTLSVLFLFYLRCMDKSHSETKPKNLSQIRKTSTLMRFLVPTSSGLGMTGWVVFLGFLTAIHYMTNAFDGLIYLFLSTIIFLLLFKLTRAFFVNFFTLIISFFLFGLPFSINFKPFATGIGVNCSPRFLVEIDRLGPFLFEKGNCQVSPLWMIFVLWGFFWLNFIFFAIFLLKKQRATTNHQQTTINKFVLVLFIFSTLLIIIPEFFYIKDIYPAHFRANTMFKLGYQVFIMMGLASAYVFVLFKHYYSQRKLLSVLYFFFFIFSFFLVAIYPTFAIPSYYGKIDKKPALNGADWIKTQYPEYTEIINYLNKNVTDQPTILEAQGDSYTDFNVVSAYTGLPTVAGWWVHEWLWRGSADVVGKIIPDIQKVYESEDIDLTRKIINKYKIKYIILGSNEKQKYKNLQEKKFEEICRLVFSSSTGQGKVYAY